MQYQKPWQVTKSEQTIAIILEATYKCFIKFGYAQTTTPRIAEMAGLSRGAMTHHFKSRTEVINAGVKHLYKKRIAEYEAVMRKATKNYKPSTSGISTRNADLMVMNDVVRGIWSYFTLPSYFVHLDLIVASRTDPQLDKIIASLNEEAERIVPRLFKQTFPLLNTTDDDIELIFDLLFFTLRGISVSYINYHKVTRIEKMLNHLAEDCLKIIHHL